MEGTATVFHGTNIKESMTKIKNELISHTDLYVWTQINFAYHSNKIEGSHLSKNQTKQIFEANDLTMDLDDALEARNHFRLFDYMLKTVDEPLSKEMMIHILADQLFEGGFIPLLKARNEFPFVHSFLLILSADPA